MVSEIEIVKSFARVKQDINTLNQRVNALVETQRKILAYLNSISEQRSTKKFIATKNGKKVHVENCPVAKRIILKNRIQFSSKTDALSHGFNPCACMET